MSRYLSPLRVVVLASVVATAVAADRSGELRLTPSEIEAMAKQGPGAGTSGVAGIRTTTLMGDPTKSGPYTIEIRVPPNTRIQAHTHRDARSAVVISGAWYFGYGATASEALVKKLDPGSFYTEPAEVAHFALTKDQPAVVFITGIGPTDTVYGGGTPKTP
jgi:quercetin dioxygenase-like cupin family protein